MRYKALLGHITFWLVIVMAYAISDWGYENNFKQAIIYEMLFLPARLIAVYINWFILIPKVLYENKKIQYLALLSLLILALTIAQRYFTLYWAYPTFFPEWVAKAGPPQPLLWYRIVQVLVVISTPVAFSTAIKFFFDWYAQKNKSKQLALEKREAELNYLRSQINPHFLFNTLNNLYGLSLERSKKVPQLLLQLSDLLSYSLYESSVDKTMLSKELKLVEDFIALERERYGTRLQVEWEVDPQVDLTMEIAPLLFMPLVENAFKHGAQESIQQSKVSIELTYHDENIHFRVENNIPRNQGGSSASTNGIGLKNLRRRLDLLYPDRYRLQTSRKGMIYTAQLIIQL